MGEIVVGADGGVIGAGTGWIGVTGVGADGVLTLGSTGAILAAQAESATAAPAPVSKVRNSRRGIPEARAFFHDAFVSSPFGL